MIEAEASQFDAALTDRQPSKTFKLLWSALRAQHTQDQKETMTMSSVVVSNTAPKNIRDALISVYPHIDQYGGVVELKGNEEGAGTVSVNKFHLVAWSPVFRAMLDGEFSEASASTIQTTFSLSVLKTLVQFCTTGEATSPFEGVDDVDINPGAVLDYMSLASAAKYYEIHALEKLIDGWFEEAFCSVPDGFSSSLWWVPLLMLEEGLEGSSPHRIALGMNGFWKTLCRLLSKDSVQDLLESSRTRLTEGFLLEFLRLWAESSSSNMESAKELADRIILARVKPSLLHDRVSMSGIFSQAALSTAICNQNLVRCQPRGVESLQSLSQMHRGDFFGGPLVTVTGAGVPDINGTYYIVSITGEPVNFSKVVKEKGNEDLHLRKDSALQRWVLGVAHGGRDFSALYYAVARGESSTRIPRRKGGKQLVLTLERLRRYTIEVL